MFDLYIHMMISSAQIEMKKTNEILSQSDGGRNDEDNIGKFEWNGMER